MRIFVFGLGYSAGALARLLKARGAAVGGTVRSAEKAAMLRAAGIDALVFDGTQAGTGVAHALADATHLVVSVAPGAADPVLAHHRADIVAAPDLSWIGYLSTVGVYGNYGGAWVHERTTPHPARGRSTERLAAEKAWRAVAGERGGAAFAVFRIAGIYGPGRNALKNIADGSARRIVKPGQVFNRIHVDDIAATLAAAIDKRASGIFNLADDEPAPPQDVVAYAAELMGVAPPPEIPLEAADLSDMARSFYAENKRVSNRRIREALGVTLRYPTYRDGLDAMWKDGSWR
jgi:nucleoside-diphosphate-sugar epimerase